MVTQKISSVLIIAITLAGIMLTVTAASVISVTEALPMKGAISAINVELYSDSQCNQRLTSVDWGTLSPGQTATKTIYIKNTGNTDLMLTMTKTNWDPPVADGPISITWDREGTTLYRGQTVQAIMTLSVSTTISGITSFNVEVIIAGNYIA